MKDFTRVFSFALSITVAVSMASGVIVPQPVLADETVALLDESFEKGSLPEGWSVSDEGGFYAWGIGKGCFGPNSVDKGHTGNNNAKVGGQKDGHNDHDIITKTIDLSDCDSATLSYWYANKAQLIETVDGVEHYDVPDQMYVYYSIDGSTWTQLAHHEGEYLKWTNNTITLPDGALSDNVRFKFMVHGTDGGWGYALDDVAVSADYSHTHSFEYSASGDTVTATCTGAHVCTLTDSKVELSIVKPELETFGESGDSAATLSGTDAFNSATGLNISASDIKYTGRGDTEYSESSTAPTATGTYTAKITVEGQTASVDYSIAPIYYSFVGDGDLTHTLTTDSTLAFTAKRNISDEKTIEKFEGILIDGEKAPDDAYTAKSGSVVVTLSAKYLNTLSVGEHTISLLFSDADAIETTFTIKKAPEQSPQTGDSASSVILLLAAMMLTAGVAMTCKAFRKKEA